MSTGMDTIWDPNINSSRITSPSLPYAPWRHWQLYKGMNEITISSQFPLAYPQRLLKTTQTFLRLTAVCVKKKKKKKKGNLETNVNFKASIDHEKPDQWCWYGDYSYSFMWPAHTDLLSRHVCVLYFHMVISSACLLLLFYRLLPWVIWDYDSMLPLALALNRPPRVSNLSDKLWTNGFSWAGESDKAAALQHRKQGLVLSCPPSSTRDGCWYVS